MLKGKSESGNCCCQSVFMSFWSGACPTTKSHLLCSQVSLVQKCHCSWKGELLGVVGIPGTWSFRNFGPVWIRVLKIKAGDVQCDTMSCREPMNMQDSTRAVQDVSFPFVSDMSWQQCLADHGWGWKTEETSFVWSIYYSPRSASQGSNSLHCWMWSVQELCVGSVGRLQRWNASFSSPVLPKV